MFENNPPTSAESLDCFSLITILSNVFGPPVSISVAPSINLLPVKIFVCCFTSPLGDLKNVENGSNKVWTGAFVDVWVPLINQSKSDGVCVVVVGNNPLKKFEGFEFSPFFLLFEVNGFNWRFFYKLSQVSKSLRLAENLIIVYKTFFLSCKLWKLIFLGKIFNKNQSLNFYKIKL